MPPKSAHNNAKAFIPERTAEWGPQATCLTTTVAAIGVTGSLTEEPSHGEWPVQGP